jgi:hypothetical protein
MSELNLNWFVKNSRELFPGEPDPILPLREGCVDVVNGKRILRCAITDCPAWYEMPEIERPPKSSVQVFLDSQAPHSEVEPSGIADHGRYICREHNPKPSQGVFFQPYACDMKLGSTASKGFNVENGYGPTIPPMSSLAVNPGDLLKMFDRREPFMTKGNRSGEANDYERTGTTPEWMFDDNKVLALLWLRFPKMTTKPDQYERAARWTGVIIHYYRRGIPAGERKTQTGVDAVMNWEPGTAEKIVLKIRRYLQGLTASTGKPITGRRGRPKKIIELPQNPQVTDDLKAA